MYSNCFKKQNDLRDEGEAQTASCGNRRRVSGGMEMGEGLPQVGGI